MLPVSATFTGHLQSAEAIYEGASANLVGVRTFSGAECEQTPQHAALPGMRGAGTSLTMCDLLSQTELYYDYTVLRRKGFRMGFTRERSNPMRARSFFSRTAI
jgi:hypothetical protein